MPIERKPLFTALAAAGVLGAGIAAPAVASAAGDAPSTSLSRAGHAGWSVNGPHDGADRTQLQDKFADALADELGVPKEKVAAALTKLREEHKPTVRAEQMEKFRAEAKAERQAALKDRLDKAVADGKLTRQEADAVIRAFDSGVLGPDRARLKAPGE